MKILEDLGFIYPTETSKTTRHYALFECVCGEVVKTRCSSKLVPETKRCKTCGHKKGVETFANSYIPMDEAAKACSQPLYGIWSSQRTRCKDVKNLKYGGRGITFSSLFNEYKQWYRYISCLPGFKDREALGLTMDRVHNDYGYEPMNLRWATIVTQNNNKRKTQWHK